ncbi:hypothetical protein TeGR_g375 [Tetraparma gracilis]|uniref:Uncharacterized protein n=1 Tax=Tetraparma gracilis TaxID=2962635 RepID=A0ABQ6MKS4_9STRA|nr:hypothetical protein TeGR_g375 [Tetraparma gracilis]
MAGGSGRTAASVANPGQVHPDDAPARAEIKFKRNSVDFGVSTSTFSNPEASVKNYSKDQLDSVSDSQLQAIADSFVLMIKGSTNLAVAAVEWSTAFLPDDDLITGVFTKKLMITLALMLFSVLKLARWGAGLRLLILLTLCYQDIITDVLVGIQYYKTGQTDASKASFGVLGVAVYFHMGLSYAQNKRKPMRVRAFYMLTAMFMLTPIIESYNVWCGKEMTDDELFPAVLLMVATRAIELIVESLPESVLQLNIALRNVNAVDPVMVFSICSSLASAAAIMTDTNISFELNIMNKQDRGRNTHPFAGLIPDVKARVALVYAGFFSFHAGYMASSLISMTACLLSGIRVGHIGVYLVVELTLYFAHLWRTGRTHGISGQSPFHSFGCWLTVQLLLNFAPFLNNRSPDVFGGRMFACWIIWRLVANTLVFALVMSYWEDAQDVIVGDDNDVVQEVAEDALPVRASARFMIAIYATAITSAVGGIITIMRNVETSHRWTLYNTKSSAFEYTMALFRGEPLVDSFTTCDGQALECICASHLHYIEKEATRAFLSRLSVTHPLFAADKVFPKEAGGRAGHSYDAVFEIILSKIKHYRDDALSTEIAAHFAAMKEAIAERTAAREAEGDKEEPASPRSRRDQRGEVKKAQPKLTLELALERIASLEDQLAAAHAKIESST